MSITLCYLPSKLRRKHERRVAPEPAFRPPYRAVPWQGPATVRPPPHWIHPLPPDFTSIQPGGLAGRGPTSLSHTMRIPTSRAEPMASRRMDGYSNGRRVKRVKACYRCWKPEEGIEASAECALIGCRILPVHRMSRRAHGGAATKRAIGQSTNDANRVTPPLSHLIDRLRRRVGSVARSGE